MFPYNSLICGFVLSLCLSLVTKETTHSLTGFPLLNPKVISQDSNSPHTALCPLSACPIPRYTCIRIFRICTHPLQPPKADVFVCSILKTTKEKIIGTWGRRKSFSFVQLYNKGNCHINCQTHMCWAKSKWMESVFEKFCNQGWFKSCTSCRCACWILIKESHKTVIVLSFME